MVETLASPLLPSVFFFMSFVLYSALFSQLPLEEGVSECKNVRKKWRQETQRSLPCCFIWLILGLGNSKLSHRK